MKAQILTWWNGLAYREQQLVGVCSIFLVIGIFYWGIWSPITSAQTNAMAELQSAQQKLTRIKQKANRVVSLQQANGQQNRNGSLSTIVNSTASAYGLTITRMQPQGDKIQLWMDEVAFDSLMQYINELVQKRGLSLDNLDVAETDTTGVVKVRRIQLSQ
ncbi:MAG: type II secretion system protein M [Parashewanella sp.]